MRATVLFLTVLGCALAVPNGYYHQEYNYKTSASAYKNNELQHKTDDQGYYRKDGDLEGRVRPRVDSNSEHSEYVNPNIRNGDYRTGMIGAANGDLSSYGHLRADVGAYGSHDLSEGMAQSDHIAGRRGAYSDFNSGSSYGSNSYGSSQSYSTSSNLRSVTSRLQQELERDLQQAIQEQRAYSHSSQVGTAELERELRQNLTNRLNAELTRQYGQQSVRGGQSYTISGGRLQSTANYDNRELEDLRRGLENNLLNQLKTQYTHTQNSQINSYDTRHNVYGGYQTTTLRPYYTTPYYTSITSTRPHYTGQYVQPVDTYPVSNRESLTTIASRVQSQLDIQLNRLLEEAERTYFSSSSSYSHSHTEGVLERLRNELRNNITLLLNEEVSRSYGNQIPKDGHMYTVGSNGATLGHYNYAIRDLENLRSQIERNLTEKLNRDFETHRSRWSQHQQSQQSHIYHSGSNVHYTTPRYDVYSTPHYNNRYNTYSTPRYNSYDSDVEHLSTRPTSSHIVPLISNGGNHYNQESGTYGISGSSSSGGSISQLQQQLQQDLSRQLQTAIRRGHYGSYSTSGSYNPQSYQVSLQQLTDELNRNLTRQLQEYSGSSYYSTYGNVDQAQMNNLRSQLQADLMRQLQQGLQQSYSSSSSYSVSSSSSSNGNYRPVRGFDNYHLGQYKTIGVATQGEDCLGDDPTAYNSRRMKRSYQPYRSQPIGLAYSGGYGYNRNNNYGYGGNFRETQQPQGQQVEELGQQVDESDLTQQVEDSDFDTVQLGSQNQQQLEVGQQVDDSDLTQQVEDSGFGRLQLGSHNQHQQQTELGQQVDNSDLTQQVEDSGFERVQLGQQTDDSDLTQQVEDAGLQKLELGSNYQQQNELGQQVDDSDLTQQVEDSHFGRVPSGSYGQQQNKLTDDLDLTQQVEDSHFGRVPSGSHGQQQNKLTDDLDLTQQVEDSHFGRVPSGSYGQQQNKLVDDSDLTQQVEDSHFGRVPSGSHGQQQNQLVDDPDLTQQVEDSGFGKVPSKLQIQQTEVGQQIDNSHLTQQVDDSGFEAVHLGTPSQQQIQRGPAVENSDLTQQVEDSGFQDLHLDSSQKQQEIEGQVEDSSDLTQKIHPIYLPRRPVYPPRRHQVYQEQDLTHKVEDNTDGKLQFGSEGQQQITDQLNINQLSYITNKLEEDLTKQLQEAIHSHQYDTTYSSLGYQTRPSYGRSYEQLLNELQSNLTKQLQHISSTAGTYGSSYSFTISSNNPQLAKLKEKIQYDLEKKLGKELSASYGYSNSWSSSSSSSSINKQFGQNQIDSTRLTYGDNLNTLETEDFKDFNQKQVQVAKQLEEDLSQQLKNAVQATYYTELNSGPGKAESQVLYQHLIDEIGRNLTRQTNSYSYLYTFNTKELNILRNKLDHELKKELQKEVSNINNNRLGQQQIGQEVESPELNQQVEENAFGSNGQQKYDITHVDDNQVELGNQQQIGQEQLGADIIQKPEDSFDDSPPQIVHQSPGKLQFGNQQIEQDSVDSQLDVTQQLVDSDVGHSQFEGQQQIVQQPIGQNQVDQVQFTGGSDDIPKRSLDNHYITQNQLDLNHQIDNSYYTPQQTHIQLGNRPVTRKPDNNFLQREREELLNTNQHVYGQSQVNYNQKPNNLPTLNQVVQQQQLGTSDFEENNTELPSHVEPLRVPENDDLIQQQEDLGQQTIDGDITYGQSNIDKTLSLGQTLPTEQTSHQLNPLAGTQNGQVPVGQTGGQSVGVTSQGQIITQPQTLTDAQKNSQLLIDTLRAYQQSRDQTSTGQSFTDTHPNRPLTYSQVAQHGNYGGNRLTGEQSFSGSQIQRREQLNSYNQRQEAFKAYLNQQQIQFAKQLENELHKQLQEAIFEDYNIYKSSSITYPSPNPQLHQIRYHQFSEKLQKNITEALEEILSPAQYGSPSFSVYVTLTDQQREKLVNQLQADLLQQLKYSLQISYGIQQDNGRNFDYTGGYSPSSTGSNSYGSGYGHHRYHFNSPNSGLGTPTVHQVNYGQLEEGGQTLETASEFYPVDLQHADVVHNVEPQSNYNVGVKGHGRHHHYHHHNTLQSSPSATGDDFQQPIAGTPPLPSAAIQVQPEGAVAPLPAEAVPPLPVEDVPPSPADPNVPIVNQEDLPWWKRIGNKVKQGAHSLKEKIVG